MTKERKFGRAFVLAITVACLSTLGTGWTTAYAADLSQQPPRLVTPQASPSVGVLTTPMFTCYVKLDYVPNNVGGLYITNNSAEQIYQGKTMHWTLQVGNNSHPQTKKLRGMWDPAAFAERGVEYVDE